MSKFQILLGRKIYICRIDGKKKKKNMKKIEKHQNYKAMKFVLNIDSWEQLKKKNCEKITMSQMVNLHRGKKFKFICKRM